MLFYLPGVREDLLRVLAARQEEQEAEVWRALGARSLRAVAAAFHLRSGAKPWLRAPAMLRRLKMGKV